MGIYFFNIEKNMGGTVWEPYYPLLYIQKLLGQICKSTGSFIVRK